MKNTRSIITTVIITLLTFGAVVYTSCRKDRCKNHVCQNGGSCSNGFCTCPTGYSGDFCETPNVTAIVYKNNTFTPVNIVVNNVTRTVSAGRSLTYYGNYGDTLKAIGTTHGNYGLNISWGSLTRIFPSRDTVNVNIDLPGKYFYVIASNNANEPLKNVIVNYGLGSSFQTLDILPIPVGASYGIGYYNLYYNSTVRLEADTTFHYWEFDTLALDTTLVNQKYNAIAH